MATGGDGAAAQHLVAEGAGGDRGADQPEGARRQEVADAGTAAAQADPARPARRGARRVGQGRAGAAGVRAQEQEHRPAGVRQRAAGAYVAGIGRGHQPGDDRHGWPAAPEGPARDSARVDRLPVRHGHAPHAPSPGQGGGPHPHPRRAATGAAQHRRGDPHHPRERRAQTGADAGVRPLRAPGRGHPGNPPAPIGTAGGHQDRAGAEGPARGAGRAGRAAEVRDHDAPPHRQGDRDRRQAVRRRPPHADPGRAPRRRRGEGGRRARHRDRLAEGLGAHAPGPWPRRHPVRLQGGRHAVRHLRVPHHRRAADLRHARRQGHGPGLLGGGGQPAGRPRRRCAADHADRTGAGHAHRAYPGEPRRAERADLYARGQRLPGQGGRHGGPPEGRQGFPHAR